MLARLGKVQRGDASISASHRPQGLGAGFRIADAADRSSVLEKRFDFTLREVGWRHSPHLVAASPDEAEHEHEVAAMARLGPGRLRDLAGERLGLVGLP